MTYIDRDYDALNAHVNDCEASSDEDGVTMRLIDLDGSQINELYLCSREARVLAARLLRAADAKKIDRVEIRGLDAFWTLQQVRQMIVEEGYGSTSVAA